MKVILFFATICMSLLLSGCASLIYYDTEIDPEHQISRQNNFIVFLPDNPTIEDKKIKRMLERSLVRNGYMNNSSIKPQYGVSFQVAEKTYSSVKSDTTTVPTTSYSTSYVGSTPVVTTSTQNQVVTDTYTVSHTYKKIYVRIFIKNENGFDTIWTGFTSSEIDEYEQNPPAIIDQLVKLIGKDFKDDIFVEMDPDENPK